MRITIDTKEDSAHEIQHIISLLQQTLVRNHHAPHHLQTGLQQEYTPPFQSSYASPHTPSSPAPPAPNLMSMFDTPREAPSAQSSMPASSSFDSAQKQPLYSSSSITGIPSMSGVSSMRSSQERPQSEQQPSQTPSIFDVFGSSADTSTKSTTSREAANDLLNYDREHDDDSGDSSYTFTTY